MRELFLRLLEVSITGGILVLVLLILRPFLRKSPAFIRVIAWSLVAFRLLCPFSVQSTFSLAPSYQALQTLPVSEEDAFQSDREESAYNEVTPKPAPEENAGDVQLLTPSESRNPIIDNTVNNENANKNENTYTPAPEISESVSQGDTVTEVESEPTKEKADIVPLLMLVWLIGVSLMLVYTVYSYIRVYVRTGQSIPYENGIKMIDGMASPFIFGLVKPSIYLPTDINESDVSYVIAHEKAHLRRGDHIWKPLGFAVLILHWFNPLVWVGYIMFCRDIEFACDERVIGKMGTDAKKPYADALINCSASRKSITPCPVAFGESGIKSRIKSVLGYKKPAFWIIIPACVSCVVLAVCFLTDPIVAEDIANKESTEATEQTEPSENETNEAVEQTEPSENETAETTEQTEPSESEPTEATEQTEPYPTENEPTEPETTESTEPITEEIPEVQPTYPEPIVSEPTEPEPTETEPTEPEASEPGPTEPQPAEPEVPIPEQQYSYSVISREIPLKSVSFAGYGQTLMLNVRLHDERITYIDVPIVGAENGTTMKLGVLVIASVDELKYYLQSSDGGNDLPSYPEEYDDEYFSKNVLIVLVDRCDSEMLKHEIVSMRATNSELNFHMRKVIAETGQSITGDSTCCISAVEFPKNTMERISTVSIYAKRWVTDTEYTEPEYQYAGRNNEVSEETLAGEAFEMTYKSRWEGSSEFDFGSPKTVSGVLSEMNEINGRETSSNVSAGLEIIHSYKELQVHLSEATPSYMGDAQYTELYNYTEEYFEENVLVVVERSFSPGCLHYYFTDAVKNGNELCFKMKTDVRIDLSSEYTVTVMDYSWQYYELDKDALEGIDTVSLYVESLY